MAAYLAAPVFLLFTLPLGFAALRLAGSRTAGLGSLAAATGLGYTIALALLFIEQMLGGPWLVLPGVAASLVLLRPRPEGLDSLRRHAPELAAAVTLALWAYALSAGDIRRESDGLSFRPGFDVTDRVYYALVARETLRAAPRELESPVYSGVPLRYSVFTAMTGALLQRYAAMDLLEVFLVGLPPLAVLFSAIAAAGFVAERGASLRARLVTMALLVLGGDLSFLVETRNLSSLERWRHLFAFYSISGESLLFNTWMFGIPLSIVSLILLSRWLASRRIGDLILAGLVLGGLWETKVFAVITLLGGLALASLALRSRPLAAAVLAGAIFAAPWIAVTSGGSSQVRDGPPLRFAPLWLVKHDLISNLTLRRVVEGVAPEGSSPPRRAAAMALATALFLVGGLGVRLVGLPALARGCSSGEGMAVVLTTTSGLALLLGLVFAGNPVATEGGQFLTMAQALLWLVAGPPLALVLASPSALRRAAALVLIGGACLSPVRYGVRKLFPEHLLPGNPIDGLRVHLSTPSLEACEWLRRRSHAGDRIALPLHGDPEDLGGHKPLFVSALSGRRTVANLGLFGLAPRFAEERRELLEQVYSTDDSAAAETALRGLGVHWIWEVAERPLRFRSERLVPVFTRDRMRLLRFQG